MPRPADHFFPDPARLRAHLGELRLTTPMPFDREPDLLALAPVAISKMAAIIVSARTLVRRSWSAEVEMSERAFEALSSRPPESAAPGGAAFDRREHRYRDHSGGRGRCTNCTIRPGLGACGECIGTGTRFDPLARGDAPVAVPCHACDHGFARCTVCEGSGLSVRTNVHHATDEPIFNRRVIVPSLTGTLGHAIRARIEAMAHVPEELRIDLAPAVVQSAYRGASGVEKPDFFGWDFLDAYDRARAMVVVASSPGTVLRVDEVWAWPFLCVRWAVDGKDVDVAFVPMPTATYAAVFPT